MANTIKGGKILLQLDDGNTIELFAKNTRKAKKDVDNLARSEQTLNRNFKGASQQSSNATKNFSKMSQGITGGLVPAYATLAANIFAIGAAFRFLQDAANYRILIQGQQEYATVTGESLKLLTSRLQEATGQQLAFAEAAQSAAIGRAAGLSSDQLSRLGAVAKNASIALGRDLTDSFNRLVRGSTKGEPELLDELGIILRLETATERYGLAIGKTKDELSTFERSQAVTNEVLRQGEEKFQDFSTELNAFTKLAKSFDDLINKIKNSLTGVAEFLAGALSKNVVALGGAFALLGTGIARAITPQMPQINLPKAAGDAMSTDIGKFYSGKNLGKFQSGNFGKGDLQKLERSMSAQKSSVLNFENFRRSEAQKTIAILKAYNMQLEANSKGTYQKMKATFLANLYIMQAEYGKFVGTMKFLGMGLTKALSFIGYAGMLLSLVGVFQTLLDKMKDPAVVKYEEAQKRVLDTLTEQNKELSDLNEKLQDSSFFFDRIVQNAAFLSNFSFKGVSDAFKSFDSSVDLQIKDQTDKIIKAGIFSGNANAGLIGAMYNVKRQKQLQEEGKFRITLNKAQKQSITETMKSMTLMQGQLSKSSDSYKDLDKRINSFAETLKKPNLSKEEYIALGEAFGDLETNATKAQLAFNKFANAGRVIKDSAVEYRKALNSLMPKSGPISTMLKQVDMLQGAFKELLTSDLNIFEKQADGTYSDEQKKKIESLFSSAQESGIMSMIGQEAYNAALASSTDMVEQLTAMQTALLTRTNALQKAAYAVMSDQVGIQNQLNVALVGATPLQAKALKNQEKQLQTERLIAEAKFLQDGFDRSGMKLTDEQLQLNDQNLLQLQLQLATLQLQRDEMYLIGQAARGAFEGGMTNAINDLLTGKESSLKDAMAKLAKGVFEGVSKQLSTRMSEGITNFMFGNKELQGYEMGAEIIKRAHVEGIQEGLGTTSPLGSMKDATGEDSGFFGKMFGTIGSFFGFAKGGITPVYAAGGGTFKGPKSGYPAMLHGNEAVVPLPDGKSIPISGGMGGNVNVSVNMVTGETSSTSDGDDMYAMGGAIAQAVQNELEKQQRPGGMLSPY